jgi:RHS repeat-associated protein
MAVAQLGGSTIASYTYDALGRRIQKVANDQVERYVYNGKGQLLGERGATSRDYVWLGGIPVANVDTSNGVSTITYVTADQLNTPRVVSDSSGSTIWQLPYQGNPWGEMQPVSNGYTYNLRFHGQYFDVETGLQNNVNRDYDPAAGTYRQVDPIGYRGGQWSLYAYVGGNPLRYTDPSGLQEYDPAEEREEEIEPWASKLGPNMADPANQDVIRQELGECKAPWNKKPPIFIDPADVAGLRPAEIDSLARKLGLDAKGPDPMNGRGSYTDPDTGQQRILSHPDAEPPHAHVNDPSGQRLDIDGNPVPNESPNAHLPITK